MKIVAVMAKTVMIIMWMNPTTMMTRVAKVVAVTMMAVMEIRSHQNGDEFNIAIKTRKIQLKT
jgi:hypothetical protein